MEETEKRIRQIISKVTDLSRDVPGNSDLYLDLGVASVHAIQLLTSLEEEFGVMVPDEDFVEATSIDKLTNVMSRLVNTSAQA